MAEKAGCSAGAGPTGGEPGEIPEFATRAHHRATPRRVVNGSSERAHVPLPFFLNRGLANRVEPAPVNAAADRGHVYRVFPEGRRAGFV